MKNRVRRRRKTEARRRKTDTEVRRCRKTEGRGLTSPEIAREGSDVAGKRREGVCRRRKTQGKGLTSPENSKEGSDVAGKTREEASTRRKTESRKWVQGLRVSGKQVCFILPKLEVRFLHQEHGLVVENNIMGIQLKSTKFRSTEDVGESTRLDFLLDFEKLAFRSSRLWKLMLSLLSTFQFSWEHLNGMRTTSKNLSTTE